MFRSYNFFFLVANWFKLVPALLLWKDMHENGKWFELQVDSKMISENSDFVLWCKIEKPFWLHSLSKVS